MVLATAFSPWARRLAFATALSLVVSPPVAAQRQADDPVFTVTNVPVEASAPDPLQARDKALIEGERRAFDLLVRRLVAEEDVAKITLPADAELEAMVKGFEFADERTPPGRYTASLSVVFRADRITALLRNAGVPYVDASAPPVLTIPLMRARAGVTPLAEKSAWREAWTTVSRAGGLVPMPMLRADAADGQAIEAEQALVGDVAALGRIAERYGARRVLVSVATGEAQGPWVVSGTVYDLTSGDKSVLPPLNNIASEKLVDAAVRQRTRLEDDWKSVATLSREISDALVAIVPIRDLAEWVKMRRRIGTVVPVREVRVQALEESRAIVLIRFVGTRAQLDKAMERQGLSLVQSGGNLTIVDR